MTSREAIEQVVSGSPRKEWTANEITEAALPLTELAGKDPRHSLYMNVYKEAARADGVVTRAKDKNGKTVFKLNPNRKPARKPSAETTAKADDAVAADLAKLDLDAAVAVAEADEAGAAALEQLGEDEAKAAARERRNAKQRERRAAKKAATA